MLLNPFSTLRLSTIYLKLSQLSQLFLLYHILHSSGYPATEQLTELSSCKMKVHCFKKIYNQKFMRSPSESSFFSNLMLLNPFSTIRLFGQKDDSLADFINFQQQIFKKHYALILHDENSVSCSIARSQMNSRQSKGKIAKTFYEGGKVCLFEASFLLEK